VTGNLVAWLDDHEPATSPAMIGSKLARLAELGRTEIQVPRGFAVTTAAYRRFWEQSGIDHAVARALAGLRDPQDLTGVETASAAIRKAFDAAPVPGELAAAITDAYEELSSRRMEINLPVAVRSSSAAEDAAAASFAGQFDTYLGLSGADRVLQGVKGCWGSLFSGRALVYWLERGHSPAEDAMAVGILELVHAQASGVAFSVHPVTGKRDRIVIEASFGWGEAIVQGLVTPDHAEVGKLDGRLLAYEVAHKTIASAYDYSAGRVIEVPMPKRLQDVRVLNDEQIAAITKAIRRIEEHYSYSVDVEWVLDRHRQPGEPVTVVQSRPVTVQAAGPNAAPAWDPVGYAAKYAFGGTDKNRSGQ
jgi:pyruvate,water dikinase